MKSREEILEIVLNAGSDSLEVFGGKFKGGYELQQSPGEISDFLLEYQNMEVENFLEIGVAAGGNTRIFCDFLKIKDVYTIDLDEHPSISYENNPNARDNNFRSLKNTGGIENFYGDSHSEEAKEWLSRKGVKFDMVFIDGDHTEQGIKLDTELVLPYLNDNAYVIYHDTVVVGVGSKEFNEKLRSGIFPMLKIEKDFIDTSNNRKGISVYRYVKG
jgi:predicted O-methyltransferase YrrM